MDPNSPAAPTPPVNPVQPPVPPVAPATPAAPAPGMQPPAPLSPQAPMPGMVQPLAPGQAPASGGSKKGLIIGIIVAVVAVIVILGLLILLPAISVLQATSRSDGFMKAITTNDTKTALTFVQNGGDSEDKTFLEAAASKVKGSYKLKDATKQNDKFYALYDLSGGDYKSARTEMINVSGKWYLDGFVYDTQQLKLVASSTSDSSSKTDTTTTKTDTGAALACLEQDDYKWISYDKQPFSVTFDSTYDPAKYTFNKVDDMFFKPDTTNEDSFLDVYDDWADFAKHNENKQWKFRLEGTTYGADNATPAAQKLANARSEKVKAELIKRGVPEDRIIIDPPHAYIDETQDDSMSQIYRRVQNTVDPTCTAAASSNSGR